MAKIVLNDVLDQLLEENNGLKNENKELKRELGVTEELLKKYRHCLLNLTDLCDCHQNRNGNIFIQSIESLYKIYYQNKEHKPKEPITDSPGKSTEDSTDSSVMDIEVDPNLFISEIYGSDESNDMSFDGSDDFPKAGVSNKENSLFVLSLLPEDSNDSNITAVTDDSYITAISEDKSQLDIKEKPEVKEVVKQMNDIKDMSLKNIVCRMTGCGHVCKDVPHLERHIRRKHCTEKPYKCTKCQKEFQTETGLKYHATVHWSPEERQKLIDKKKVIVCTVEGCQFRFTSEAYKERHIKKYHFNQTLDKKYECLECDKKFFSNQRLSEHMNALHSLIPILHKCQLCPFESKYKWSLTYHMKTLHIGAEKTVKCMFEGCPKRYTNPFYMKMHFRRKHRILECKDCHKKYSKDSELELHRKVHSKGNYPPYRLQVSKEVAKPSRKSI